VRRQGSGIAGFAVFSRRERPLKFRLGEVSLGEARLGRYWHLGDPYLAPDLDENAARQACFGLVRTALANVRRRECLYFEGLPTAGPLFAVLHSQGAGAASLTRQIGKGYEHQFIDMPGTYADYIAKLGSRSRQSVLYSQRRLTKDMNGDLQCRCFESEADVAQFVADAQTVSRKTYQWNLLGLGLRDAEGLAASLRHAARTSTFRCFILYCAGKPAAFMLGQQHPGCYYYDDVGFDPDFTKHSVGSVLQIMVLEQLLGRPDRPRYFDFSTGYGEHKGRFGNLSRSEADLLVMPATVGNRLLLGAYGANERFGELAVRALDRAGVKDKLKKLIRRRSQRSAEPQ
jgi:hypothetical protein